MATALELPDLLVGHVLDELLRLRRPVEELLADELSVVRAESLEVTVGGGVHQVDEFAGLVPLEQLIPLASPDDLDDGPAGTPEEGLELLDDLGVAADGSVETLQVAVDHEGQVVQVVQCGELDQATGLRLVHLTVTEERPHVLLGGVLDTAVVQVAVEPCLVDGVHRTEAHGHGRELPEIGHTVRVRVAGHTALGAGDLLAETVHVVLAEPTLEERASVHAGGGVALEEDLVAAAGVVLAAEEVVEADLVQRGRGGVGGDVAAHTDARPLGAVHHDRRVPAHPLAVAALDALVAGELGFHLRRDGVDVVRRRERR